MRRLRSELRLPPQAHRLQEVSAARLRAVASVVRRRVEASTALRLRLKVVEATVRLRAVVATALRAVRLPGRATAVRLRKISISR